MHTFRIRDYCGRAVEGEKDMGDLQKIFNPRTIAVIGATEKEGPFGRVILENVLARLRRSSLD